jgi:hypothetical protein
MKIQRKQSRSDRPPTRATVRALAKTAFDDLADFCQTCDDSFWEFETQLLVRIAVLGAGLIRLFLTARYERLDLQPFLEDGKYRPGDDYAERSLKTYYGEVTYGRHYLMSRGGGSGFFRSTWCSV